jgi:Ala-tRNA(Pro) deacylase
LLERSWVRYGVVPHAETVTSRETARDAHVPADALIKVVVLRDERGGDILLALPASEHFDRDAIHQLTGRYGIHLEDETELRRLFPDSEIGAMPPIGHLYGLPMLVDPCLSGDHEVYFPAGNHHEVIRMHFDDFARIARPFTMNECLHKEHAVTGG